MNKKNKIDKWRAPVDLKKKKKENTIKDWKCKSQNDRKRRIVTKDSDPEYIDSANQYERDDYSRKNEQETNKNLKINK